jgi:malonate decarboxylase delta subunit
VEKISFRFENGLHDPLRSHAIVGVVGSGNLEVLIESVSLNNACEIEINTAAKGFNAIWQAVIDDFQQRWQLSNARISINDMGATPAVVSLRLDQAVGSINGTDQI